MLEEKKEGRLYLPRPWGAGILFCLLIVVHLLIGCLDIPDPVLSIVVSQGMIVLPAFIYAFIVANWQAIRSLHFREIHISSPFRFLRFRKFHIGSAFLIPLLMLALLPVMGLLNAISMLFATNVIGSTIDELTSGNVWKGLLLVAVIPACVEEITFRGALYHSLRGARPVRAIILSGFMFGAMHMNFNQFVYATALGIIMAFLVEATGSIWSSILLHFCINGNSVVLMTLLPKLMEALEKLTEVYGDTAQAESITQAATDVNAYTTQQMLQTVVMLIPIAAIGAGIAFLLFMLIAKLNQRWGYIKFLFAKSTKEQRAQLPKPNLINVFTVLAFLACFIICVLTEILQ